MRLIWTLLIASLVAPVASASTLQLEVDVSERLLTAFVDGEKVKQFDVSVGKPENPTPRGAFKIKKLIWNPKWVPPPDAEWADGKKPQPPGHPDNPMKRVKMFFQEPDYYIHGTDDEDSLGKARSHGCVRMSPSDVTELARLVMSHGGKPQPLPWYRRVLRSRSTKVVILSAPVALRIKG